MRIAVEAHDELRCVGCGYLLRGLDVDARCPECGQTVRNAIAAQTLASWPSEWLRRLRFALRLLTIGIVIGWLVVFWFTLTDLSAFNFVLPGVESLRFAAAAALFTEIARRARRPAWPERGRGRGDQ